MTDMKSPSGLMADQLPSDSRHARQLARRQLISEAVMAEGSMRIEDLTERFGISLMTAHRDLDELASRGLLRKTRGIVSAAPTSLIESSAVYRSTRQEFEKRAIAAAAQGDRLRCRGNHRPGLTITPVDHLALGPRCALAGSHSARTVELGGDPGQKRPVPVIKDLIQRHDHDALLVPGRRTHGGGAAG